MYLEIYSTESLFPYISGIHAFINTDEYELYKTHSDEKIALKMGLTETQVKKGIELLLKNQAIKLVNNKYALNFWEQSKKEFPIQT